MAFSEPRTANRQPPKKAVARRRDFSGPGVGGAGRPPPQVRRQHSHLFALGTTTLTTRRRNRNEASRGKSRVSLGRGLNPLGIFPLPGEPFRVSCRRFPPEIGAREPVSLAAPKRFCASTFQRRWPDDLTITECRSESRPCRSDPRRPSSSAVAANEVWSPGGRLSLVSPSSRPDRGPGGHSPRSGIAGSRLGCYTLPGSG